MRLTARQQATLGAALRRHFGPKARLWVFGSRVDDAARGGDFDLMVQADEADVNALDWQSLRPPGSGIRLVACFCS